MIGLLTRTTARVVTQMFLTTWRFIVWASESMWAYENIDGDRYVILQRDLLSGSGRAGCRSMPAAFPECEPLRFDQARIESEGGVYASTSSRPRRSG